MNGTVRKEGQEESFTLAEMRVAYRKWVEGQPLTEKEKQLVEARQQVIRQLGLG